MSRETRFPTLMQEPKLINGAPPAYHSGTATETDTWSEYSGSSGIGMGKRRNSWTNLIESDENLNKHKVNIYPKVANSFSNQLLTPTTLPIDGRLSRPTSQMQYVSEVYEYRTAKGSQPVQAEPTPMRSAARPAGTLPSYSKPTSRAPSVAPSMRPIISPNPVPPQKPRRNRLQDCKSWCLRPVHAICLFCILLVLIIGAILAIVLTQVLKPPSNVSMSWFPPEALQMGQKQPTKVEMTAKGTQVKLQLQGAIPFKGNYISYYDFKTSRVAVIDESLKNSEKNSTCFVLPLDRRNLQNEKEMRKAAAKAKKRQTQTTGWEESWTWLPNPILTPPPFDPPVPECEGARWIQLDKTSDQKDRKCTDCHDFCLPDYGIETEKDNGDKFLNIARRNCFYLFVPEWRTFAQSKSMDENQRDFEQYYRDRQHLATSYGGPNSESKWIPLSVIPLPLPNQQVLNQTAQQVGDYAIETTGDNILDKVVNTARTAVVGSPIGQAVFGQNNNNNRNNNNRSMNYGNLGNFGNYGNVAQSLYPQNGNINNNMNYGMNQLNQLSQQGIPNQQGVADIVNLQGVNGNTGSNMYKTGNSQMNNQQPQQQQNQQGYQYGNSPYQANQVANSQQSTGAYNAYSNNQDRALMNGFGAQPTYNSQGKPNPPNTAVAQSSRSSGESYRSGGYVPNVVTQTSQSQPTYQRGSNQGNTQFGSQTNQQTGYQTQQTGYQTQGNRYPNQQSGYNQQSGQQSGQNRYPSPMYPATGQTGRNPSTGSSGYQPQVQQGQQQPSGAQPQGVVGVEHPSSATSARTGYTPDVVVQSSNQQPVANGRWVQSG